jgi:hypothetical protein
MGIPTDAKVTEKRCFLFGPCRDIISRANLKFSQSRLQNKVLRTIGNLPRRTPIRDLHMALKLPYKYDYVAKLCRQQAEVIQTHENANVRNI